MSNKKEGPVNELNQSVKGISLWQDAWRRLKKNKMAVGGLVIIIFYAVFSLLAPILPIYSYKQQVLDHQFLPPGVIKTAGDLLYEKKEKELNSIAKKAGRQLNVICG